MAEKQILGLEDDKFVDDLEQLLDEQFPDEFLSPNPTPTLKPEADFSKVAVLPPVKASQSNPKVLTGILPPPARKISAADTTDNKSPLILGTGSFPEIQEEPSLRPTRDSLYPNDTSTPPAALPAVFVKQPNDASPAPTAPVPKASVPRDSGDPNTVATTVLANPFPKNATQSSQARNVSATQSQTSPAATSSTLTPNTKIENSTKIVNTNNTSAGLIELFNMTKLIPNASASIPRASPSNATPPKNTSVLPGRISNVSIPAPGNLRGAFVNGSTSRQNHQGTSPILIVAVVIPVGAVLVCVGLLVFYVRMKERRNGRRIFPLSRGDEEKPSWIFEKSGADRPLTEGETQLYNSESNSAIKFSLTAPQLPAGKVNLPRSEPPFLSPAYSEEIIKDVSSSSDACISGPAPSFGAIGEDRPKSLQISKKFMRPPGASSPFKLRSHLPSRSMAVPVVDAVPIIPPANPAGNQVSLRTYGQVT